MNVREYQRIQYSIEYLERHFRDHPSLDEVARAVGLSPFHFQRLFKRWAGISPKRFVQFLTIERAQAALQEGRSALQAAYEAGLSGPGRLHDLFVAVDAVTPGEFKEGGAGLTIRYGIHPSPFGACLVALTDRGICGLEFVDGALRTAVLRLKERWPAAHVVADPETTEATARRIFARRASDEPLTLFLRGTNFQIKVWEALLTLPPGTAVSYSDIAAAIGHAGADRAVGSAVGRNPIAYLIPCHRVLRRSGAIGSYRWGTARKRAMLAWEAATSAGAARAG